MINVEVRTPLGLEGSEFYRLYLKNRDHNDIWISVDISEFDDVDSISDSINKWQQEYQCEFINTDEKDK